MWGRVATVKAYRFSSESSKISAVNVQKSSLGSCEELFQYIKAVVWKYKIFTANIAEIKREKLLCRGLLKHSCNLEKIAVF